MSKILIISPDKSFASAVTEYLETKGYFAVYYYDIPHAPRLVLEERPDCLVLDLSSAGANALDICGKIRQNSKVVFFTLVHDYDALDRILFLEMGADCCLPKSVSFAELATRLKVSLRRVEMMELENSQLVQEVLQYEGLEINFSAKLVKIKNKMVSLTTKEYELLTYLARHLGKTISRDLLFRTIWGFDSKLDERVLDSQIHHLREKLSEDILSPRYIHTIYGVGYRFGTIPH
jgi:DNA-binding response OmpR family regulator